MARIGINTGATANDGTGDNLRAGAGIVNDNFLEIYNYLGAGSTTELATPLWRSVSAGINTLSKVGVGTTAPTSQLTVSGDAIISGVTTLNSSSGVGTVTVGYGNTALFVDGEARIIGILTVGRGSITFDGNNNNITVGSGITITGSTGIIEATSIVTGVLTATTFSGDGSSLTGVGNTNNILTNAISVSGVSTLGNTLVGGATTEMVVGGDLRVTGVITATSFSGDGSALTGVGAASTDNILTNAISVSGVSTLGNTVVGGATTEMVVGGNLRVTGVVTATSFSGDGSALTGISAGVTTSHTNVQVAWSVTANGTSAFRFAGPGNDGAEDNPDLYLVRGQRYRFTNNSGGSHPFEIRSSPGGSAFSDGVTNNAAASGNIDFNVQHDAPNRLYYQCTNHAGMLGNIYILRQNAFGNGGFNELDAALFN